MKLCTQHKYKYVTHICTYRGQCGFRQACQDCIEEQIHQHERYHTYLIEINRFNQNLEIISPQYINTLKSQLLVTEKLAKEIQLFFDYIQKILKYEEIHQQYIQNNYNISILDDQQLDSLLSIDSPLEYDSENNLIVVCKGNNILFYDPNDYLMWEHKIGIEGQIAGMQIINKGQNLITLNYNYLTIWQVDHDMQWLQPIQQFHHQNMLEFRFINNDQIYIIREDDKIMITNNQFQIRYQLRIQLCRSVLQSINYLIIEPQLGNFLVLKNEIKHM